MDQKTKEIFYDSLKKMSPALQPSWAMDQSGIQDSFCFRALEEARKIAQELIDSRGEFKKGVKKHLSPIYTAGYSDDLFRSYHETVLKRWASDAEWLRRLRRFSLPLFHSHVEEIIRGVLDLPLGVELEDFHVQQAVITACLTPLRQTIGSCFATAPAIQFQRFCPDFFIEDLYELLSKGRLRRVIDGVEYTAPCSLSTGAGHLLKEIDSRLPYWASPGIIRAFEAGMKISPLLSFLEKVQLSESLCEKAFRPGMKIKELITAVVGQSHEKEAWSRFKNTVDNGLLKIWEFTLASYCDIKMEFAQWNLGACIGLSSQEAGGVGAALYQALDIKLQNHHQLMEKKYREAALAVDQLRAAEALARTARSEDEMRRLKSEIVAKAHHAHVCEELYHEALAEEKIISQMLVFLITQYTQRFQHFFQEVYDPELLSEKEIFYEDQQAGFRLIYKHGRADSSSWTVIRDEETFLKILTDFFRAVELPILDICKEPYEKELVSEMTTVILNHLITPGFLHEAILRAKKQGRLPWAYSSGGSVEQIAPIYFRKSSPLKGEKRPIQDELDLFTFMIEVMKGFPPRMTNRFIEDPERSLLFESPTHISLLLPGSHPFQEAWNDSGLTYTWIRDQWMMPADRFYAGQRFSKEEQKEVYRRVHTSGALKTSMTLEEMSFELRHIPSDVLGQFFFQTLPLVTADRCQALLHEPWQGSPFLSSEELFRLMIKNGPAQKVREKMRNMGLACPRFLFADTNWPNGYFSFVLHPVTRQVEVWKTDRAGVRGAPLPLVKSWFGQSKASTWSIYEPL